MNSVEQRLRTKNAFKLILTPKREAWGPPWAWGYRYPRLHAHMLSGTSHKMPVEPTETTAAQVVIDHTYGMRLLDIVKTISFFFMVSNQIMKIEDLIMI